MSAKHARMLLFSLSNINPHLSACSNSGLPQPVCFADRLTDRTGERDALRVCKARCRCHILDCCTSFFMQSRRLSSVYFRQRGMLSLTAALPNKRSCIYQRQDKTHLIWTSNSLFTHSQAVQVFQVHLSETVVLHKHPHLDHQHTAWDHLQMWEPIKYQGEQSPLMQWDSWLAQFTGHIKTKVSHQSGSDVTDKYKLQHICFGVIVLLTCVCRQKSLSGLFFSLHCFKCLTFQKVTGSVPCVPWVIWAFSVHEWLAKTWSQIKCLLKRASVEEMDAIKDKKTANWVLYHKGSKKKAAM